jgi:DNA-binding XRE family transcriptional regulator
MPVTQGFNLLIPATSKPASGSGVAKISRSKSKLVDKAVLAKLCDDIGGRNVDHGRKLTNYLPFVKTRERNTRQIPCPCTMQGMDLSNKPFGDIAERVRWHRDLEGLTQLEYSQRIGVKRATLNNWESGDFRLSLDGALALRNRYGLSLDFMYEGIVDALPMTLRNAWLDKPDVNASK